MPELSSGLQFYIKHAADVGALWEEEGKPDGVGAEEWATFRDVLEELKSDAEALLHRLFIPLETGLSTGFIIVGRKAYKVRDLWDYYRQFKPSGKGNRGPVGCAGVQIIDEPAGGSFLVVYATGLSFTRPDAASVVDRCPNELMKTLADKLVVASLKLSPEITEEALAQVVAGAVPDIIAVLKRLSE